MAKLELDGGKYAVVNELYEGGGLRALRYGEEWRNLAGDNLVLAMYHEIERLRKAEAEASLNHRIYYARAERLQAAVDGLEEENDALREALELKGAGE